MADIPNNETWVGNPAKRIKPKNIQKEFSFKEVEILCTNDAEKWKDYLNRIPNAHKDIYLTPEYHKIQENHGLGKAFCFVFKKGNELVMYPHLKNEVNKDLFNLSATCFDIESVYGYGGFISNTTNPKTIEEFALKFNKYCIDNLIIAEFVRFNPLIKNEGIFGDHIQVIFDRKTVSIDLTKSYIYLWEKEYSSSNRNTIRKAILKGINLEIINNPNSEEITKFYEIYIEGMGKLKADDFYSFSKKYIQDIFNNFSKSAYLFNVKNKKNEIMCSSIFLHFNEKFHYHLSARSPFADNTSNNFLIDRAVLFAQELGASIFHLGGGRTSSLDDSLFKFKKCFSKTENDYYIGKKIHNQSVYEMILNQWNEKSPEKMGKYKNVLLKYRY